MILRIRVKSGSLDEKVRSPVLKKKTFPGTDPLGIGKPAAARSSWKHDARRQ
jgi:hypothetical protein